MNIMCELEYIGQLGSKPFHHIFTCRTHPHNFFSKEKTISVCDRAPTMIWKCRDCKNEYPEDSGDLLKYVNPSGIEGVICPCGGMLDLLPKQGTYRV